MAVSFSHHRRCTATSTSPHFAQNVQCTRLPSRLPFAGRIFRGSATIPVPLSSITPCSILISNNVRWSTRMHACLPGLQH